MKIKKESIVELSHKMLPGKENFNLQTRTYDVVELVPEATHRPDVWYVVSDIAFSSHMGTHIEFPFHHLEDGANAGDYPIENMIGEAVVLEFTGKKAGDFISLDEVKKYKEFIREGDIIFIRTDLDKKFRDKDWEPFVHIAEDALLWLLEFKPKIIGSDGSGIEVPDTEDQPNHFNCFRRNVAIVESLTNLAAISGTRLTVFILPLPIEGIDACPVRVIAIKEEA